MRGTRGLGRAEQATGRAKGVRERTRAVVGCPCSSPLAGRARRRGEGAKETRAVFTGAARVLLKRGCVEGWEESR